MSAETILPADDFPVEKGKTVPIKYNPDGTTTLLHFYRKPGQKGGTTKKKTIKTQDAREVSKAWAELVESCDGGSLTVKFKACVELAVKYNGGGGMPSVYAILKEKLGRYYVDKKFPHYYTGLISELKAMNRSANTVSNYISCVRRSLNLAYEQGLIETIPIRKYEITREYRDRIWTTEEKLKIYNGFEDPDNDLYWKIYYAERNPIRMMDLSNLKRTDLKRKTPWNPNGPYVVHYPRKTKKSAHKPCILPEIDQALLDRFDDLERRFPDCPYLFPRIVKTKKGEEAWAYAGNFDTAFVNHLSKENVNVVDFHFHDLKHVAISGMLGSGRYSRDDLKKLGIQMSDESINVYDQTKGLDCLKNIRKREDDNGLSAVKKAV